MNKTGLAAVVLSAVMGTTGMAVNNAAAQTTVRGQIIIGDNDGRGRYDRHGGFGNRGVDVRIYEGRGRPYCKDNRFDSTTCFFPSQYLRNKRLGNLDQREARELCSDALKRNQGDQYRGGISQWLHDQFGRGSRVSRQDINSCAYNLEQERDGLMRPYWRGNQNRHDRR